MSDPVLRDALNALHHRRELDPDVLRWWLVEMISGRCGEAEAAALLVALRMKGESAGEIAVAAQVLRDHMIRWDPGLPDVLDTCGTGGDGLHTFNISTATALVAAGVGVPVVKHGNRSVSSRSGSADVLGALGVHVEGDAAFARACLRRTNLAFCFAPAFHPALKHVGPVRRKLGVPTIFNCVGPLANPASARHQLLGVGRLDLLDRMAFALAKLGGANAILVCGQDGLDEVSLAAPTQVRVVRDADVRSFVWTPDDFELAPVRLEELVVSDAAESAAVILAVLAGKEGPAQRIVLANAAAALLAFGKAEGLREGVASARAAIVSGKAMAVLEAWRGLTPSGSEPPTK